MTLDLLHHASPDRLLGLLSEGAATSEPTWGDADYPAIWLHQLNLPLVTIVSESDKSFDPGEVGSIAALLREAKPTADLVHLVTRYAKAQTLRDDGELPAEVARVLYFLCVWVGRYRCEQRLSSLSDARLLEGLRWSVARPWLDAATRERVTGMIQQIA